jgi:hypothetical protein
VSSLNKTESVSKKFKPCGVLGKLACPFEVYMMPNSRYMPGGHIVYQIARQTS